MPIYSKESLEVLRQRIDLADVLSSHLDLKRSGASYKGLCPFHDEKSPSFMVQKGDKHYHCFGCGAHGDAVQFLMTHLKMSFPDAIESLAQRFNVPLQMVEGSEENKGPNKASLKEALDHASRFFQFCLLHTAEGHEALQYLYKRGIDLDFIHRFGVGWAPKEPGIFRKVMHGKFIKDEIMADAGLISPGKEGRWRDFFSDRITFPICDASGAVIGFSARKYKEETFGGKYINTPETPLFKKSKVLFGLHHCRRRIAKDRTAIIVEGQIDALRLISAGLNITVAGQGTAFGEGHARELLSLGINQVYLALDSDEAGRQAAFKIGDIFQKEGIETRVVMLGQGQDPDSFLRAKGVDAFLDLMKASTDYLTFVVNFYSGKLNISSPAGKNELVQTITKQIRSWEKPLMVHESLRKLAHLMDIPEEMIGVGQNYMPNIFVKKSGSIGLQTIDPDKILEMDLLRWLILAGQQRPHFAEIAKENIQLEDLRVEVCRSIFQAYLESVAANDQGDLVALAMRVNNQEGQEIISALPQKKVNLERADEHFVESIQKILDRNWMEKRESLKARIQSAQHSDEETTGLVQQFTVLNRTPPRIKAESAHVPRA